MINFGDPTATLGIDETDDGLAVTIDTERLCLTSIIEDDRALHNKLHADPVVMEKFAEGVPLQLKKSNEWVSIWVDRWKQKNPFSSLTVSKQDDDKFVGQVMLRKADKNPGEAEIGYIFAHEHWGKGFGKEAALPVIQLYAKELADKKYEVNGAPFTTLVATARTDNPGSYKILEKEMEFEKDAEVLGAMRKHYRKNFSSGS